MQVQAQIKLSFNPVKGEKYVYLSKSEQAIKQTVMGKEIPVNVGMDLLYEMIVKEKSENEISVECTYKEMVFAVSNSMMNLKYDSKNPVENPSEIEKLLPQVFSSLIGKTIRITFAPDGSVKSLSGFKAIMEEMLKTASTANPAAQQMTNGLLQSFSDEAMKTSFEQSYKIYPDKEVKVGANWTGDFSNSIGGMDSKIETTYTLKEVKNNIARIEGVSSFILNPGMGMEGELSGEQQGEINLDTKTGMLVHSTLTQNSKGKFNAQGTEILMDIVSKTTLGLQE
ncbi:hypothetical protein FACS189474_4020 [Bacteroidia bacterium]|nr:hypothetical protein FACS189474_4020 [Bacteroidia bacterium]